jgi:hypothetical protein
MYEFSIVKVGVKHLASDMQYICAFPPAPDIAKREHKPLPGPPRGRHVAGCPAT